MGWEHVPRPGDGASLKPYDYRRLTPSLRQDGEGTLANGEPGERWVGSNKTTPA